MRVRVRVRARARVRVRVRVRVRGYGWVSGWRSSRKALPLEAIPKALPLRVRGRWRASRNALHYPKRKALHYP